METRIVKIPSRDLGHFKEGGGCGKLEHWEIRAEQHESLDALQHAAQYLRTEDTPVAFPTETVYGLGADATRSASVKGIYVAKGRPSDNPLIVHVCDLQMLRSLLEPAEEANGTHDPLPTIYRPLIERFWPGPLTILLPNPKTPRLAPEVTAGLSSFGARMPASNLALSLIKLANTPLAAPSANASTKPSPTTAQHVLDDLEGRVELILDGGPCEVGVESTVVDGLCDPPVVLRPGGISIDDIRRCPGWERVTKAYKDQSEIGKAAPRAPGMKYKHYSPKARVVLYESTCKGGQEGIMPEDLQKALLVRNADDPTANGHVPTSSRIGVVRTRRWKIAGGLPNGSLKSPTAAASDDRDHDALSYNIREGELHDGSGSVIATLFDIELGEDIKQIAHGLFSALRELDRRGADVVFVDGVEDNVDIAAAVMNRLRKAASEIRS